MDSDKGERSLLNEERPVLNGLVLAGGKSVRMGNDKGLINWHGKEQRYYTVDLLRPFCRDVFISCRSGQQEEMNPGYETLIDTYTGLGPYGAILSAFAEQKEVAWLVVACDLPLLDAATLHFLVEHRNSSTSATAFESPHDGLPEPLITIWEPKSYLILLSFLQEGSSCPRKALRMSDVTILKAPNPGALMNANTPEDAEKIKGILDLQINMSS